jgi:hypothetical protein
LKGKRTACQGIEFGEAAHWKSGQAGGSQRRLSSTWHHGVYLGVKGNSGELVVADENGVRKTRTAQRKPKDGRRDAKNLELAKAFPWKTDEGEGTNPPSVVIAKRTVRGLRRPSLRCPGTLHPEQGLGGTWVLSGGPAAHFDFEESEEPSTAFGGVQAAARGSDERFQQGEGCQREDHRGLRQDVGRG